MILALAVLNCRSGPVWHGCWEKAFERGDGAAWKPSAERRVQLGETRANDRFLSEGKCFRRGAPVPRRQRGAEPGEALEGEALETDGGGSRETMEAMLSNVRSIASAPNPLCSLRRSV